MAPEQREQLEITEQYSGYWAGQICCYCGEKLIDADIKGKRKFGLRGWSKKDNKYKWYCWNCH